MTLAEPLIRIAVPPQIDPSALAGHDPSAPVEVLEGATMGTTWRVQAALPPHHRRAEAALTAAIDLRLADLNRQMSHWDADSLLCRFNTAPAGRLMTLPDDFARVIGCALGIAKASDGAFDPTLGRLTDQWGLGPCAPAGRPDTAALEEARSACGWRRLGFDPAGARLRQPGGLWLDLSGIAKGYAVDAVAALLAARGIRHALVEIGGECAGCGLRPDGDPWWVELEAPPTCRLTPLRVALHQLSVATSGDYLAGAHMLDPANGQPIAHATTAVSVLHRSCMIADAWATALCVAEPRRARDLACTHDLAVRIVSRCCEEWLSPALQRML